MRVLYFIDMLLYIPSFLMVLYLLVFAVASRVRKKNQIRTTALSKINRIIVLIPAYKEDEVIIDTVQAALNQNYDQACFDVYVISDHMLPETDEQITHYGGRVINIPFRDSSKAKALNYAIKHLSEEEYEIVIILDADNLIGPDFLLTINRHFNNGCKAIQAHRTAKNTDTDIALLDAVSEEINNSIFRKGHVALGLSSALIGSGMAFDYSWFSQNVTALITVGEDKDLELILIRQNIRIYYLDDLFVYDEKTRKRENLYNQRRRWIAAQFGSLRLTLPYLFNELGKRNWNYLDKLYQWLQLPRVMLLGFIFLMCIVSNMISFEVGLKWLILLCLLSLALVIAIPSSFLNLRLIKVMLKLPGVIFLITKCFFRTKGASKQFIHTDRF